MTPKRTAHLKHTIQTHTRPWRSGIFCLLLSLLWLGEAQAQCVNTATVTRTLDSGTGSLRWAIERVNSCPGQGVIDFSIPGTGPHRITITSSLPIITEAVLIDGFSEPGAFANTSDGFGATDAEPMIELRGAQIGVQTGLSFLCADGQIRASEVRGLVINGFVTAGIFNSGCDGVVVAGNFIGTDVSGSAAPTAVAPDYGVVIHNASGNRIGGTDAADRNLLSAHAVADVLILGNSDDPMLQAVDNLISNNFVGTDATGLMPLLGDQQSGQHGIVISDQGTNPAGSAAEGNRITNNLVSGHLETGIWLVNTGLVQVTGNIIGADRTAAALVSDLLAGHDPVPVPDVPGMGNLQAGLRLGDADGRLMSPATDDLPTRNTLIAANAILHNGHGVWMDAGTGNSLIRNALFSNSGSGIHAPLMPCPAGIICSDPSGRWELNAISDNGALDIDLNTPGPDVDSHELMSVVDNVYTLAILDGIGMPCEIQWFANSQCDPSGQGESRYPLGESLFDSCPATLTFSPATLPLPGAQLTAVVSFTRNTGPTAVTTSTEASRCLANAPPVITEPIADQDTDEDALFQFTVPESSFADPNGDMLLFAAAMGDLGPLPDWLSFDASMRRFTGTPDNQDVGAIDVRVTVTDSSGPASISDEFRIQVVNVNDAPQAADDAAITNEGLSVTIHVLANDTDEDLIHGDSLTVDAVSQPASGVAERVGQSIVYTPAAGFSGSDSFTYTVSDQSGAIASASVQLTVRSDALFGDGFETPL